MQVVQKSVINHLLQPVVQFQFLCLIFYKSLKRVKKNHNSSVFLHTKLLHTEHFFLSLLYASIYSSPHPDSISLKNYSPHYQPSFLIICKAQHCATAQHVNRNTEEHQAQVSRESYCRPCLLHRSPFAVLSADKVDFNSINMFNKSQKASLLVCFLIIVQFSY